MTGKLFIVGVGPGSRELWTLQAIEVVDSADRILGTLRIAKHHQGCRGLELSELLQELKTPIAGTTAVLVGGDCCFFSIARRIIREFSTIYAIEQVNGIGSIPYLSAKIGVSHEDACLVSLHGRDARIVPHVAYNGKVFALTGGTFKAHDLCRELSASGLRDVHVVVGENLSYPDERIVHGTPALLENELFDDLSVVYVENEHSRNPHLPLRDVDFIRSESLVDHVPMTKEEIRWLAIQKLAISPDEILYDIGSGTGSVAVEMGRKAFEGIVYAVEQDAHACTLVEQNRRKHGAYNVHVVPAVAPEGLDQLPIPDGVFIGGSSGKIAPIMESLLEKNTSVRIVASAVTLQSLSEILEAFRQFGPADIETLCINIAKSKRINRYDFMMAQNPVYILCRTASLES